MRETCEFSPERRGFGYAEENFFLIFHSSEIASRKSMRVNVRVVAVYGNS